MQTMLWIFKMFFKYDQISHIYQNKPSKCDFFSLSQADVAIFKANSRIFLFYYMYVYIFLFIIFGKWVEDFFLIILFIKVTFVERTSRMLFWFWQFTKSGNFGYGHGCDVHTVTGFRTGKFILNRNSVIGNFNISQVLYQKPC